MEDKLPQLNPELLEQAKRLHIHTRRLADQGVTGRYRSAFRGQGIEFEEVRAYYPGDDIRAIDWKVTARTNRPYIKSFREERETTVMIAVDVSASTKTGTRGQLRESLIAQVGALLTLIALRNNDKVGLVTFSDRIETYHPPRKARSAVWRILHEVLSPSGEHPETNLGELFSFINLVLKRKAVVFVISDFISSGFERELASIGKRHDVNAMIISDPVDFHMPNAGLVHIQDPETAKSLTLDTSSASFRAQYEEISQTQHQALRALFRKHRVGTVEFSTNRPFLADFKRYFDKRSSHLYQSRAHSL